LSRTESGLAEIGPGFENLGIGDFYSTSAGSAKKDVDARDKRGHDGETSATKSIL
jgi:hypothetical protein